MVREIHISRNVPYDWSHKQAQLLHLWTGTATRNLSALQNSAEVNVCCGIMHDCVLGNLFAAAHIITANIYLDTIRRFVFAQSDSTE
jgi:hypothetical protein